MSTRSSPGLPPDTRLLFMQSNGGLTDAARSAARTRSCPARPAGSSAWRATAAEAGDGEADRLRHGRHLDRRLPLCRPLTSGPASARSPASGCARRCWRSTPSRPAAARSAAIDGRRFRVGPDSAGAVPGPACYRRGGPLTVTDCNVVLGKITGRAFPGGVRRRRRPADRRRRRRWRAARRSPTLAGRKSRAEVAEGFVRIAVDNMANAIKQISIARGHDVTRYTLQCFGGAGGQHACLRRRRARHRAGDDPPARRRAQRLWHRARRPGGAAAAEAGRRSALGRRCRAGGRGGAALERRAWRRSKSARRAALRYEGSDTSSKSPSPAACARLSRRRTATLRVRLRRRRRWSSRRRSSRRGAPPALTGRGTAAVPESRRSSAPPPVCGRSLATSGRATSCIDRAVLAARRHHHRPRPDHRPLRHHRGRARLAAEVDALGNAHPHPHRAARTAPRNRHRGRSGACWRCSTTCSWRSPRRWAWRCRTRRVGEHQGAARFLLRPVRPRRRADRQRAAHPGASRLDGREHPDDHRRARRQARDGRGMKPRRRLCAQRALSRRHASAGHHGDHAGLRRRRGGAGLRSSPRAAIMPISAASRPDRCRPTAGRSTTKAC